MNILYFCICIYVLKSSKDIYDIIKVNDITYEPLEREIKSDQV